jgi:tetratricopeptide (TPR) repeat protein
MLAALALGAGACAHQGPAPYQLAMAQASRDESAGRLAEAVRGYDRAAGLASRAPDRDQARWNAADVAAHEHDIADAAARFDAIASSAGEHQAEAAYRAALLRVEHGNAEEGWRQLERVTRRFPSSGIAHVAVRKLVAHADDLGPAAGAEELAALGRDLASTELAQLVAFLTAEHVEASGQAALARDSFLNVADRWPYPFGSFFDEALWRASLLDERLGRSEAAIADLERLVSVRETTSIMGSYERLRYVPAVLRIGELYRDRLHDRPKARAAFHRLYTEFDRSTKRAKALWLEAALWWDDGDRAKACSTLATMVREFPDSRYVPCAVVRCPELRRPEKSGAPLRCPAYIEEEEEEEKK